MILKGRVFEGAHRGEQWIEKFSARLINILGFKPFPGTLNVKMEENIDIEGYSTKRLEHDLIDAGVHTDAYFTPVKLIFNGKEKECWAMRDATNIYEADVVELVAKEKLIDELSIVNGDTVEIDFGEKQVKRTKVPGFGIVQDFLQSEHRKNV